MEHGSAGAMAELSKQLAHPLRVMLLGHVAESGPCPFSELAEVAGVPQAQVSNHLAVLRKAGLLATERQGRQSLYRLPNSYIAEVLANLRAAVGGEETALKLPVRAEARSCYDHIGGRLGVDLLRTLLARGVVTGDPLEPGDLAEGEAAAAVLPTFGVPECRTLRDNRRRFAYGCPDWTEKVPHLGGALGAAVAKNLHTCDWVRSRPGSRALDVTELGREALRELGVPT
jgi:DNA-binding transcriptional ArsR family regulator